ncbi:MAG: DUF4083 domain-containing protein [Bacillus sp. (in: firmicutes)]
MDGLNVGDVIVQLFAFGFLILAVMVIILLVRSTGKGRRNRLDELEKRVEQLEQQLKRDSKN